MRARVPLDKKTQKKILEFTEKSIDEHIMKANEKAAKVFILASACTLHQHCGFGKTRIERFMNALSEFYDFLGGYDDSAAYKCVEILERAGVDVSWWKEKLKEE